MLKLIFNKIFTSLPTVIGVSLLAFLMIRLVPGDPVLLLLGERGAEPAVYEAMKAKLSLDRPLPEQYWNFVKQSFKGDLGTSIVSKQKVTEEFWSRMPATLELGLTALLLAVILGIPLGIFAALKKGAFLDTSLMTLSLVGYSLPIFWWGLLLILFFSMTLGLTPVSGRIGVEFDIPLHTGFYLIDSWFLPGSFVEKWAAFKSSVSHLVLPTLALATIPLATLARMTRATFLDVLGEDYIRTAKTKRLSTRRILFVHALRNALIPIVTVIGLLLGSVVTGAILTETIFSWPGIGKWLVQSVSSRDYPVIQGGILLISLMIIGINILVDLIYIWINPRMHKES